MFKKQLIVLALGALGIVGCGEQASQSSIQPAAKKEAIVADTGRIKAHLSFLADDLMGGRDTGSPGHETAALYIATQMAQYGLEPAGDEGTYFQRITFRQSYLDQESPKLTLTKDGETVELDYPAQYITGASVTAEQSEMAGKMVFVGYGIIAPELNHDDYADLDVDGKVVVMLTGKPASFPTEEGAHFSSGREKAKHAAEHGAIGMITITTPMNEKSRPYQNRLNFLHVPSVAWLKADGEPANSEPSLKGGAYLGLEAAKILFEGAPTSLDDIYAQLEEDKSPKGFDLAYDIALSSKSEHKEITSPNVVALLEGSDPELKKEYVVYSAHSDHIGFAKTVKKDRINNGAMDNASGTSIMLETARLFSTQERPKRSILFVSVTAEEKGLLGSDYFAQNPTVPIESIVADVNLDMPLLTHEFLDLIAFGANHSDLKGSVSAATAKAGMELADDPWPHLNLFTRSDHYSFVKQGVPSVFLFPGLKSTDPNKAEGKAFNDFMANHYHKPSDELNAEFNWPAAKKFTEANFYIGNTIANQANRPTWNDDSFFGNTFGRK